MPSTDPRIPKPLGTPEPTQTLREVVHVSAGGESIRFRLSNAFGKHPLHLKDAHIAQQASGSTIVEGSGHAVSFSGESTITIPAGADVLSDPVVMHVTSHENISISFTTVNRTATETLHFLALQTSYTAPGEQAGSTSLHDQSAITSWPFLTEVQTLTANPRLATVVALGDSITDGAASTVDTNRRWPDRLLERFDEAKISLTVTNAGIAGNRVLHDGQGPLAAVFGPNALSRLNRDVFAQAGVRYVILLLGINDIGQPGSNGTPADSAVSAVDIEFGLRQIVEQAHDHGIQVMGATLMPCGGSSIQGYSSPDKDAQRQAVNAWIRTSGVFDAVADFDKAVQDPKDQSRLRPEFNSGDHLHPTDAGMQAMAAAIPLNFFSTSNKSVNQTRVGKRN